MMNNPKLISGHGNGVFSTEVTIRDTFALVYMCVRILNPNTTTTSSGIAAEAYMVADRMLIERDRYDQNKPKFPQGY
jgi:hypothetical protein